MSAVTNLLEGEKMPNQTICNRREFAKVTATALGGSQLFQTVGNAVTGQDGRAMIIDCHAHIYGEDEKTYPTIPKPYRPPAGKGTLRHLKQEMQAAGVRYVTAIQTSTFYRWDNRFTTDSARVNKQFMVGVCTLNPDDPGSGDLLERYVRQFNVRGMRSVPAKSGRLVDPGVEKLWATAQRLGIVINVLTNRDKVEQIESMVKRHPGLRVVIDHCLSVKAGPTLQPTLTAMISLARFANVHAKLTFIPTGTAQQYPCRDMHNACLQIIEAFSPARCVWGSDFPCELWCPKVSYVEHLKIFTHELGLDSTTKRAILGETAQRLWFEQAE